VLIRRGFVIVDQKPLLTEVLESFLYECEYLLLFAVIRRISVMRWALALARLMVLLAENEAEKVEIQIKVLGEWKILIVCFRRKESTFETSPTPQGQHVGVS
jgi:hypothetical protein